MTSSGGPSGFPASIGMIHGRFQPFHNGHLEYLLAAAARCQELLIGLANPDSFDVESSEPHRHLPESNPFTYAERVLMLDALLGDLNIQRRAHVVPFPIHRPAVWADYVPDGTVHFLRVFDAWGRTKAARLEQAGFDVVVLHAGRPKTVSGFQVRALLLAGERWEQHVPRAVARVIRSLPAARACQLGLPVPVD